MAETTKPQCLTLHEEDGSSVDILNDLESFSEQLREFCGGDHDDDGRSSGFDGEENDDASDSAMGIANECLALLTRINIEDENDAAIDAAGSDTPAVAHTGHGEVDTPPKPNGGELLRELDALGGELQDLMTALCSSGSQAEEEGHGGDSMSKDDEDASANQTSCTSPKMDALLRRLERRDSVRRVLHSLHPKPHPWRRNVRAAAKKTPPTEQAPSISATRQLLNDSAFWREYQSKGFRQHMTRQVKARQIQQGQKENAAKAVEYRYRRVPKSSYPQVLKRAQGFVSSPIRPLPLVPTGVSVQKKRSYLKQFSSNGPRHHSAANDDFESPATASQNREESTMATRPRLLCGVYLYGRRRNGMLYLTCSSFEQLTKHTVDKLGISTPILHLYREQVSRPAVSGAPSERKFLQCVSSFNELHNGDLLCATTDPYQDMEILCTWIKKRQQVASQSIVPISQPKWKAHGLSANANVGKAKATKKNSKKKSMTKTETLADRNEPGEPSLRFTPPPPAPLVKLWDANGRLMSVSNSLLIS